MWRLIRHIIRNGIRTEMPPEPLPRVTGEEQRIQREVLAILGRALTIRQVDSGSCNACELEIHALNNPYYNIEGLGIRFVASPRHADMLLVTGPVSRHMEIALRRVFEAIPAPKLVVAVGDCAHTGGMFCDSYAVCGGAAKVLPVDVVVTGCPPAPVEILRGILTAVQRSPGDKRQVEKVSPRPKKSVPAPASSLTFEPDSSGSQSPVR